jgi:glucose/arabinose dehydrogenase
VTTLLRITYVLGLTATAVLADAASAAAQQLVNDPIVQANFTGISQIGSNVGNVTQMVFGPDGRLYVATFTSGVKRYDYSPTGGLTNPTTVWSRTADPANGQFNGSLGIAFHQDPLLGTVMYLAPAVSSGFNVALNRTQSIIRLTNNNENGTWGEPGEVNQAIVNNLRVTDLHQVNQLLVDGNSLYAGIGSRTRTGGQVSEYGGVANVDDGEFAYTGSINWIRDLTKLSSDTTTPNLAGFAITQHHTDTQPFTSTNTGKLTVYSTGFRNVFGLAMDSDGQLWATMNQNENPLKPDELHRSNYKDDHKFPKRNEVSGDWKQNAEALAAGFFQSENSKNPVALLGNHASADGLDFTDINNAFAGHAFLVRYSQGDDLLAVDPDTGTVRTIATGFVDPLDVLTDPSGHLLVGTHGGGGQIFRVTLAPGAGLVFCDLDGSGIIDAADWAAVRDNFNADLSGLTALEAYAKGDLNNDFLNDSLDFALFQEAYEGQHGPGAFARLLAVPETSAVELMATSIGLLTACNIRWRRRPAANSKT